MSAGPKRAALARGLLLGGLLLGGCDGCGPARVQVGTLAPPAVPLGSCRETWCWDNPRPQGNGLSALALTATGEAWAAGDAAAALRFDGQRWEGVALPRSGLVQLRAAWAAPSGEVWLVGESLAAASLRGVAYRVRGGKAELFEVPDALGGVWGAGGELWAAGAARAWRFGGAGFQPADYDGLLVRPKALWGSGPSDLWAVGLGGVQRYDGARWAAPASLPVELSQSVHAVGGTGPSDVWLGGEGGLFRYDGASFRPVSLGAGPATAVVHLHAASADEVYAVAADGRGLRFDGRSFAALPAASRRIRALAGRGAPLAVGEGGLLARLSPGGWTEWSAGGVDPLTGLSLAGGWAVSSSGAVWRREASGWTAFPAPSAAWSDVAALGPTSALAVGAGGWAMHFDGAAWRGVDSTTAAGLSAVWASPGSQWLAVGSEGTALRFDGSRFERLSTGTTASLLDVWGASATDAWAVGSDGALLHYDGDRFTLVSAPTRASLRALGGTATDDVWAAGIGELLHFDGRGWTAVFVPENPLGLPDVFTAVAARARDDAWFAGTLGLVHWNGAAMERQELPTFNALSEAEVGPAGELWLAGAGGAVLVRAPAP